jgi:peptidoglycan/LPS O-acetylase OafA/YrhL
MRPRSTRLTSIARQQFLTEPDDLLTLNADPAPLIASFFGPTSVLPSGLAVGLALVTMLGLARWCRLPASTNRHQAIDGLRGYLAFFVLLHHAVIWFFHLQGSPWTSPPSRYYTHLGGSSVSLFFMITSFLFFSRVLEARDQAPIAWGKLYVSRLFRIAPLYLTSLLAVWLIIFACNGWRWFEDLASLGPKLLQTALLGIYPLPPVPGFEDPGVIVAGVYWTLSYEWFFYGTLPLWALLCGARVPFPYLAVTLLSVLWVMKFPPTLRYLLPFGGGMVVALLVRSEGVRRACRARLASPLIPLLLLVSLATSANPFTRLNMVLLAAVFLLIAGGNSCFGLLEHRVSRMLGELSFGIYLLHGLLLFLVFQVMTPVGLRTALPAGIFWAIVFGLIPVLLGLALLAHRWIEQPGIRWGRTVAAWLDSRQARHRHSGAQTPRTLPEPGQSFLTGRSGRMGSGRDR